jgi:hypothetical protein
MDIGTPGTLFTIGLFGSLGWVMASRRRRPSGLVPFVILLGVAAAGFFVGTSVIVFGVDGFKMFLSWIIVSSCLGGCFGLLMRNRKSRQLGPER